MNEKRIDFAKWLRVLSYIAMVGLVNTFLGMLSFLPQVVTGWINRILMAVMVYCMFQLAPANERYKKAGFHRLIVLTAAVVTEIFHIGAVLTLITGILSIIADYQEYHGHSELIEEKDYQLSGKWSSLFMWSILAGIVLGFTSMAAAVFTTLAGLPARTATILIAGILAVPEYVIEVLYILYLRKMVGLLAEKGEGYDGY